MGYTILDHPADLGIEARGKTLAQAFEAAAAGLMSIIIDPSTVQPLKEKSLSLSASDHEHLLVKWLSEVLYLYDGGAFVGKEFSIRHLDGSGLTAVVRGETFVAGRHTCLLDVKAVTYHQLSIREDDDGCIVRVYLDI
jgi:SHS2 domain-containing protein